MSSDTRFTASSGAAREDRSGLAGLGDAELVELCKDGDSAAWSMLVSRFERLVISIPRRYGMDEQAAEDVFQEVFVSLVRQLPSIRRTTALPKWFITTSHRVCVRWMERNRRCPGQAHEVAQPAEPPATEVAWLEEQHQLRQAMERLDGRCRELLECLYSQRGPMGYADLAQQLKIPVGSIGPTRARCLKKLLALLEELEDPARRE